MLRVDSAAAAGGGGAAAAAYLVGKAVSVHVTELSRTCAPLVPEAAEVGGPIDVGNEGGGLYVAGRVDAHRQEAAADLPSGDGGPQQ